jgi:hypothetical protein
MERHRGLGVSEGNRNFGVAEKIDLLDAPKEDTSTPFCPGRSHFLVLALILRLANL